MDNIFTYNQIKYIVSRNRSLINIKTQWNIIELDVFIIVLDADIVTASLIHDLSVNLLQLPIGWVEVFGKGSEFIHDNIDKLSTEMGKQKYVGDGNPMTTWNEDSQDINDTIDYVLTGGQGTAYSKLLLLIGNENQETIFLEKFSARIVGIDNSDSEKERGK